MKGIHHPNSYLKDANSVTDDSKEGVELLLFHRIPWLLVGLIGGITASFMVSRFEQVISQNISLAFFLPLVVYMSDAVGTQTEAVYIRNLAMGKVKFTTYLIKEFFVGIILGTLFGMILGLIAFFWIGSPNIAMTVGLAMFTTMSFSPILALVMPSILTKEHKDPALGSGPFTTIVQDILSVLIYFYIASSLLF